MYGFLLQLHSVFRWLLIILLVVCLLRAIISWIRRSEFQKFDASLNKYLLMVTHTQFLLGIVLYFVSPSVKIAFSNFKMAMKISYLRYWAVEHVLTMFIAIILITIGYALAKKKLLPVSKYRSLSIYYFIALLLILVTIPWPFKSIVSRGWI